MRILIAVLMAAVFGIGVGAGTAALRIRQYPWKMGLGSPLPAEGGRAAVDQEVYNFGKMYMSEHGKHEFTITNQGDHPLTLNTGSTSCSCTVSKINDSDLAPGQSTTVLVTWKAKGRVGNFEQHVSINTSDQTRPEITFTIKGEYTQAIYADPDELTFGHIAGNEPATRKARIFCNLPNHQLIIQEHQLSDPSLAKFFHVEVTPLGDEEVHKKKDAVSGVLVSVTVKPGLLLGPFQQRILLATNSTEYPEVDLPVFGSVGEVTLVGAGWSSESGVLEIGEVDGRSAAQRRLIILARGPAAKDMNFKVVSVDPDILKVKLGRTTVIDTAAVSQTELTIEIPERKAFGKKVPASYMGGENGKLGEILLETVQPPVHSLRIRVRFAVADGG
jgi:hypothetical protein